MKYHLIIKCWTVRHLGRSSSLCRVPSPTAVGFETSGTSLQWWCMFSVCVFTASACILQPEKAPSSGLMLLENHILLSSHNQAQTQSSAPGQAPIKTHTTFIILENLLLIPLPLCIKISFFTQFYLRGHFLVAVCAKLKKMLFIWKSSHLVFPTLLRARCVKFSRIS